MHCRTSRSALLFDRPVELAPRRLLDGGVARVTRVSQHRPRDTRVVGVRDAGVLDAGSQVPSSRRCSVRKRAARSAARRTRVSVLEQGHPAVKHLAGVEHDRAPRLGADLPLHDAAVGLLRDDLPVAHLDRALHQVVAPAAALSEPEQHLEDVAGRLRIRGQPAVQQREALRRSLPARGVVGAEEPGDPALERGRTSCDRGTSRSRPRRAASRPAIAGSSAGLRFIAET